MLTILRRRIFYDEVGIIEKKRERERAGRKQMSNNKKKAKVKESGCTHRRLSVCARAYFISRRSFATGCGKKTYEYSGKCLVRGMSPRIGKVELVCTMGDYRTFTCSLTGQWIVLN